MDAFIGSVMLFAAPNYNVQNYVPCDGRLLPIVQYQALFALVGTTYGGDGHTTFAVPRLSGPAEGLSYQICVNGIFPSRS